MTQLVCANVGGNRLPTIVSNRQNDGGPILWDYGVTLYLRPVRSGKYSAIDTLHYVTVPDAYMFTAQPR